MNLKKINPNLKKGLESLGLEEANEMQLESWSLIKSGSDCVLAAPKGFGKTTTLGINALQKLGSAEGESTRALILVKDRDAVIETTEHLKQIAQFTDLRIIGVHEKGDIDYDKNMISLGMDLLIGTPVKISQLLGSAGFNITTVRFIGIDDSDVLFKNRFDSHINRMAESVARSQYVFTCSEVTERVEIMADKLMTEPLFLEMEEDENDE